MTHSDFGKLQASFALMRDSITILGYFIDKKSKNIPIDEGEHRTVREHSMWLKIFMQKNETESEYDRGNKN